MIKLINLDNCRESNIPYGGHAGSKKGIIYNNENWFIKFPKSTKSMEKVAISYTTSPLSEYIGSKIYESIGIDVHQTFLATYNNKLVVCCKDVTNDDEIIIDYNAIKNKYDEDTEKLLEDYSSSNIGNNNDYDEIMIVMNNNPYFKEFKALKERFFDMFIVDAIIGNSDRNEANWGLILNKKTKDIRLCPVYDNGAAFNNKADEEKFKDLINDEHKFKQNAYDSAISFFWRNGKQINPLKFIEESEDKEIIEALKRIVPKISLEKIHDIIYNIPIKDNDINVIGEAQKEFYYKVIETRYSFFQAKLIKIQQR